MKLRFWVEAMNEVREEVIDTEDFNLTDEEWNSLTAEEKNDYVETWAYEQVRMGFGFSIEE